MDDNNAETSTSPEVHALPLEADLTASLNTLNEGMPETESTQPGEDILHNISAISAESDSMLPLLSTTVDSGDDDSGLELEDESASFSTHTNGVVLQMSSQPESTAQPSITDEKSSLGPDTVNSGNTHEEVPQTADKPKTVSSDETLFPEGHTRQQRVSETITSEPVSESQASEQLTADNTPSPQLEGLVARLAAVDLQRDITASAEITEEQNATVSATATQVTGDQRAADDVAPTTSGKQESATDGATSASVTKPETTAPTKPSVQEELLEIAAQLAALKQTHECNDLKCNTCQLAKRRCRLKSCVKCRAAWYCCRECQLSDWDRHRSVCKEMRRLDKRMDKLIKTAAMKAMQAFQHGFECQLNNRLMGVKMTTQDGNPILVGTFAITEDGMECDPEDFSVESYSHAMLTCNVTAGKIIRNESHTGNDECGINGFDLVTIGDQDYIMVGYFQDESPPQFFHCWPYPNNSGDDHRIFLDFEIFTYTVYEGRLYVVRELDLLIHVYDISSFPCDVTSYDVIDTDLIPEVTVTHIRVMKYEGERRLLIISRDQNHDTDGVLTCRCYTASGGSPLWSFNSVRLDNTGGIHLSPAWIAADDAAHVFVADRLHSTVAVVYYQGDQPAKAEALVSFNQKIVALEFCRKSGRLCIALENEVLNTTFTRSYSLNL